jgi:hypothetical protein
MSGIQSNILRGMARGISDYTVIDNSNHGPLATLFMVRKIE